MTRLVRVNRGNPPPPLSIALIYRSGWLGVKHQVTYLLGGLGLGGVGWGVRACVCVCVYIIIVKYFPCIWAVFNSVFHWAVDVLLLNVLNVLCKWRVRSGMRGLIGRVSWWTWWEWRLHPETIKLYCIVLIPLARLPGFQTYRTRPTDSHNGRQCRWRSTSWNYAVPVKCLHISHPGTVQQQIWYNTLTSGWAKELQNYFRLGVTFPAVT